MQLFSADKFLGRNFAPEKLRNKILVFGRHISALVLVFLSAGCGKKEPPPAPGAPVKVRFQTDWFPEPEHGGYYQAQARGYYAEEGLDVEILPGGPNATVMATVAARRADLGMTNGSDVITGIARGIPVRIVAAEMQHDPQGILYHEENPIRSLRDLDGRTLMAGPGSVWVAIVRRKYGITFNLQPLMGDLGRFMNDPTFIQQCFVTNEPYFARRRGAEVGALLLAATDLGYDPYRVIFAGKDYLAQNPDTVRRFVRASIRGWIDYLNGDPAPANRRLQELRPDLPADFFPYCIQAMKEHRLVEGIVERGERAGLLTRGRLQDQIDLLREAGVLEKPVAVDDVASFEFNPPP